MRATLDAMGRIVIPKALRDALGLSAGSVIDISRYGEGLHLLPGGRTARLVATDDGTLVADSATTVSDDTVFELIDATRR